MSTSSAAALRQTLIGIGAIVVAGAMAYGAMAIPSAAGYAGIEFDPTKVDLSINGTPLYRQGAPLEFDAAKVSASIKDNRDTHVVLSFSEGDARIRFWTTDLTAEYIRLNADYHT